MSLTTASQSGVSPQHPPLPVPFTRTHFRPLLRENGLDGAGIKALRERLTAGATGLPPADRARLDLIYSRSMFSQSTPSAGLDPSRDYDRDTAGAADGRSPSSNLGLEGDVRVFYRSDDGFNAWLEYGLFIPFDGLDRAVVPGTNPNEQQFLNASIAQTIQAMLAVTF